MYLRTLPSSLPARIARNASSAPADSLKKDGFQLEVFDGQKLQINQSLRVDAKLSRGPKTATVEVKEQVDVVETADPTRGASVAGGPLSCHRESEM